MLVPGGAFETRSETTARRCGRAWTGRTARAHNPKGRGFESRPRYSRNPLPARVSSLVGSPRGSKVPFVVPFAFGVITRGRGFESRPYSARLSSCWAFLRVRLGRQELSP